MNKKSLSKRADEFGEREYEIDATDRDALSKGYYWGYKDAINDVKSKLMELQDFIDKLTN